VNPNSELQAKAFGWLKAALEASPRRASIAAGLKPRIQAISEGQYSDTAFGYGSFRELLKDAASAGIVSLGQTPGGDLDVQLQGEAAFYSTEISPGSQIRPDLWRAAIDWTPALIRYFDRTLGRAVMFPALPFSAADDDSWAEQRKLVANEPSRFVAIDPISEATTLAFMRSFATTREGDGQKRLLGALDGSNPASAFTREIRLTPGLAQVWHISRARQVAEHLAEWAKKNDVTVEIVEQRPRREGVPTEKGADALDGRSQEPATIEFDRVRESVIEAVRRMPVSDLLRLPIPIEFLVGR
jgi:hypothetical protein